MCSIKLYLIIFPIYFVAAGESFCVEEGNGAMNIVARAKEPSADCIINGADQEKDKEERRVIGIGEVVILTFTGKGVEKKSKVTWTVEGGGANLYPDGASAILVANLTMNDSNVTIKAQVPNKPSATISFQIKKPTHLTAKRVGFQSGYGDDNFALIGKLFVTVHPTSVSFANCGVIEKDGGKVLDTASPPPFETADHNPGNKGDPPNARNEFDDEVHLAVPFSLIYSFVGSCSWTWLCDYKVTDLDQPIQQIEQVFTVKRVNSASRPGKKTCTGTIKKFGVEFSANFEEP